MFRNNDWPQFKNASMKMVDVFELKTFSGGTDWFAVINLARVHCGLGKGVDKVLHGALLKRSHGIC